ncbi:hypothetical protein FBZ91_12120 [Nitrospirillum viridazoti]|uniref:Alpha/beta hydrolase n=2 Tax=Nitrospirillum TaxID=1543705 RepID=A0A248JU73_9PROT|nr:alpha/beta hydrolase [Nitrospirillum amazonense CBAmc]TWB30979.1 hypothetical protein FBZ91_12120 [Nitrospirillum amazonense]
MMRRMDFNVPVDDERWIAMTVFAPVDLPPSGRVFFLSPGGGYARGYYDMAFPGHHGYSQAEHHTSQGHVVIAYDHLGVGESCTDGLAEMTIEDIADANAKAVLSVMEQVRRGTLSDFLPALPDALFIGAGQSMGGGVSILMQGRHACFDAIAVLGYSAIHTVLPQRTTAEVQQGIDTYQYDRQTKGADLSVAESAAGVADFRYPFHWEDVPPDILAADMAGGYPIRRTAPPFGSLTIPNCVVAMMSPGFVADEAEATRVPVFLGFGERDTSVRPHQEPAAFPNSQDITLSITPTMAHMHNFASTRHLLWNRLSAWAMGLVAGSQSQE